MSDANFEHVLCFLIFVTRLGDIISTRLITPTMMLEANPVMKRLGWGFAMATVLMCLIPYYSTALGVTAFVMYCIVCAHNFGKVWLVRTMGEAEFHALILTLARRSSWPRALAPFLIGQGFLASIGLALMVLGGGSKEWSFWIALGILLGAFAMAFYGTISTLKTFRIARAADALSGAAV